MATFADLSSDIIMAIICIQNPEDKIVSSWKNALRMLSICRSWRAAMLPVVYATVFIAIPQDGVYSNSLATRHFPLYYKAPYTNAGLIYENGYGFLAKRMFIRTLYSCTTLFTWLYVSETLNIDEDKYPEISAVREWMESDTKAEYQRALQNSAGIRVFSSIASVLALRFPNISTLRIKADESYSSTPVVLGKFVSMYASQLVKVNLNGFKVSSELLKATNIRYFDYKIRSNFLDAPFINPELLVSLKLYSYSNKKIWNQFVCDNDTNSIEFTNLETLQLTSSKSAANTSQNTEDWQLKFPKLTHLKIDCGMFTNSDFQHMASNLKTLDYAGPTDIAAKLLENDIGCLERLHLSLSMHFTDESDNERFISLTNPLFSMAGPIPEFSCSGLKAELLHMPNIYWPNLTRLKLATSIEPYEFICLSDRIPHLQHLFLIMMNCPYEADELEDSDEDDDYLRDDLSDEEYCRMDRSTVVDWSSKSLSRLSGLRSELSQSKLATLTIHWYTHGAYDRHFMNGGSGINAEEEPELVDIFSRQPRCQSKRLKGGSSDIDRGGNINYYYDCHHTNRFTNNAISSCEVPMEDAEADIALKAYFPNLVCTRFAYVASYSHLIDINLN